MSYTVKELLSESTLVVQNKHMDDLEVSLDRKGLGYSRKIPVDKDNVRYDFGVSKAAKEHAINFLKDKK